MNVFHHKLNGDIPIWVPVPRDVNSKVAQQMLSTEPASRRPATVLHRTARRSTSIGSDDGDQSGGPSASATPRRTRRPPPSRTCDHADGIQSVIDMAGKLGVGTSPFQEPCFQYSVKNPTGGGGKKTCNDLTGVFSLNGESARLAALRRAHQGSPDIALGEGQLTAVKQARPFRDAFQRRNLSLTTCHFRALTGGRQDPAEDFHSAGAQRAQAADVDYALSFDNTYGTASCTVPFRRTAASSPRPERSVPGPTPRRPGSSARRPRATRCRWRPVHELAG